MDGAGKRIVFWMKMIVLMRAKFELMLLFHESCQNFAERG